MMLDHSAGVPALREKVKNSGPYEWDYMTDRLAAEEPFWAPGTRNGYHGFTFGWTVGEMVRRASGKSLGTYFQDEIAKPLGLDFWIGLPEAIEPRVAPMIPYIYKPAQARTPFMTDLSKVPTSPASLFFFNTGDWRIGSADTRAGHAAEIGAANGITNARGLAGMYAPLARGGGKLVDRKTLTRMGEVSMATHDDATLRIPTRFALGFMKSMDNRKRSEGAKIFGPDIDSVIMSSAAFGHVGAGGSLGFADPAAGMSFGYTMNSMGPGLLLNERGQALVDAPTCLSATRQGRRGVGEVTPHPSPRLHLPRRRGGTRLPPSMWPAGGMGSSVVLPVFRPLKDRAVLTVWSGLCTSTTSGDPVPVASVLARRRGRRQHGGAGDGVQYVAMLVAGCSAACCSTAGGRCRRCWSSRWWRPAFCLLPVVGYYVSGLSITLLIVASIGLASLRMMFSPAMQTTIPTLVPDPQRAAGDQRPVRRDLAHRPADRADRGGAAASLSAGHPLPDRHRRWASWSPAPPSAPARERLEGKGR
jgi:CubicO group peptidase (beta-lactamase class C family)